MEKFLLNKAGMTRKTLCPCTDIKILSQNIKNRNDENEKKTKTTV